MDALKKKFPEARLVYLDIYNPLQDIIQHPARYGNQTLITLMNLSEYVAYIQQLSYANNFSLILTAQNIKLTLHSYNFQIKAIRSGLVMRVLSSMHKVGGSNLIAADV